jgi:hypothetical protein
LSSGIPEQIRNIGAYNGGRSDQIGRQRAAAAAAALCAAGMVDAPPNPQLPNQGRRHDLTDRPARDPGLSMPPTCHERNGLPVIRAIAAFSVLLAFLCLPSDSRASFLSPELEDKLATFIALFVLFVVPVVLIVLFWLVHILPEKIAHKRHHPQFEAIRTLCLLSLVFGGLLWPFAWLWAYSKPVFYKMAYGRDVEHHPAAETTDVEGVVSHEEAVRVASLRDRIARLEQQVPASELQALRANVDALEAKFAQHEVR